MTEMSPKHTPQNVASRPAQTSNWNLPNLLSVIRLAISPVMVVLLVYSDNIFAACYWAVICASVAELTDLFDGILARKYQTVTDLGKILDPLADSIYRTTAFITLAVVHDISAFMVLPILYRDSIVLTLRRFCAYKGIIVAARWSGKLKAIFQGPGIIIIMVLRVAEYHGLMSVETLYVTANSIMGIICVVTLYSAVDYTYHLYKLINTERESPAMS